MISVTRIERRLELYPGWGHPGHVCFLRGTKCPQQLQRFLTSIRKKNALVLRRKLEESNELHRGEKPL